MERMDMHSRSEYLKVVREKEALTVPDSLISAAYLNASHVLEEGNDA